MKLLRRVPIVLDRRSESRWVGRSLTREAELELIAQSRLFDENWYRDRNDVTGSAIAHYVDHGAILGLAPHPLFDTGFYLGGIDGLDGIARTPLGHFVATMGTLQPSPHPLFDAAWYSTAHPHAAARDEIAFRDYVERGAVEGLSPHPLFDAGWYRDSEPDLVQNSINPLTHFVELGAARDRNPNPFFETAWYRTTYRMAVGETNPLVHYVTLGGKQGFATSPLVDLDLYRSQVADVPADDMRAMRLLVTRDRQRYSDLLAADARRVLGDAAQPAAAPPTARDGHGPDPAALLVQDPAARLLAKIAQGRRVVDFSYAGGGVTATRAAIALSQGATDFRVVGRDLGADAAREIDLFLKRHRLARDPLATQPGAVATRRWQPYWTEDQVQHGWIVDAHINERDIANKLGVVEVAVATELLCDQREPLRLLHRLGHLARHAFIVRSHVTEPFAFTCGPDQVGFGEGEMWPLDQLSPMQSLAVAFVRNRHDLGVGALEQSDATRAAAASVLGAQCQWILGPGAIARMIEQVGFRIVETLAEGFGQAHCYLAVREGATG